jgi:hypothetical protein
MADQDSRKRFATEASDKPSTFGEGTGSNFNSSKGLNDSGTSDEGPDEKREEYSQALPAKRVFFLLDPFCVVLCQQTDVLKLGKKLLPVNYWVFFVRKLFFVFSEGHLFEEQKVGCPSLFLVIRHADEEELVVLARKCLARVPEEQISCRAMRSEQRVSLYSFI